MLAILNPYRALSITAILLRVLLCLVIGGVLGLERGKKNHPAGFRTYMLVCLGAAMVMMTNQFASEYFGYGDPVRMGAQVVSGIGFLGAGTIVVTGRTRIKGITTAAGLWTAACCGLAIGIGFYELAALSGITIWLIMEVFTRLDARIHRMGKDMEIYLETDPDVKISDLLFYIRNELHMDVNEVHLEKNKMQAHFNTIIFTLRSEKSREESLKLLSNAPGIYFIEELRG